MYNAAVIDYDKNFTSFNQFLFKIGKLNDILMKEDIIIEDKVIKIYKIPVTERIIKNEKKFNKIIKKFILYLKEKKINKIIISDKLNNVIDAEKFFKNEFDIFDGKSIIKYKFSYIIKKGFNNNIKTKEIVFFSNDFTIFHSYFIEIFKNFRIQTLVTDYKNMFLSFIDEIYSEYGIMINIKEKSDFYKSGNLFVINTDMKMENEIFDLDVNNMSLIFSKNENFKEFYKYLKISDEKSTEFLIYCMTDGIKKSNITEFFKRFNIRIVKINKK